jgi:hypothetical protein
MQVRTSDTQRPLGATVLAAYQLTPSWLAATVQTLLLAAL